MGYRYKPFDWYETPLYYDIVFDAETELECAFLDAIGDGYVRGAHRRILEPACGSGRLVLGMARRGYHVTGFDISDGSLAFAGKRLARARARRALEAEVFKGWMQSFRVRGTYDLAHCLVSTFRYLLTEDHARAHLRCVARSLRRGGVYVLGFHLSEYDDTSVHRERWVATRGDVKVTCNIQSWPANRRKRREPLRSRLVVDKAGAVTRYESNWQFRTYSVRQFRNLLAQVPEFEHVDTFTFDYDLDAPCQLGDGRLDQVVILQRR